jgi:hypothetical protein
MPPLREWWREINREERRARADARAKSKARGKKRPKCRCQAYPWPHRPGGGLCRFPEPPLERWQPKGGSRPYHKRYAGIRRQIARANGLHPIRDRDKIAERMPTVVHLAKGVKRQRPRMRYRNVQVKGNGITVYLPVSGQEWGLG